MACHRGSFTLFFSHHHSLDIPVRVMAFLRKVVRQSTLFSDFATNDFPGFCWQPYAIPLSNPAESMFFCQDFLS
jgi:hypothetical protein